jgi:uncharacterized protein
VYAAQGFEYDYGGVIIGRDLVWRQDHGESNPLASRDPAIRTATNFGTLVRHSYKVLLTRGLLGCAIYSVDQETQDMLATLDLAQLPQASSA